MAHYGESLDRDLFNANIKPRRANPSYVYIEAHKQAACALRM